METRRITTENEQVYDILNNMIHHNEIILDKKDIRHNRALRNIVTRFKDNFEITDDKEQLILKKIAQIDVRIRYRSK